MFNNHLHVGLPVGLVVSAFFFKFPNAKIGLIEPPISCRNRGMFVLQTAIRFLDEDLAAILVYMY